MYIIGKCTNAAKILILALVANLERCGQFEVSDLAS